MPKYHKRLLRAAGLICQQLIPPVGVPSPIQLPTAQWQNIGALARGVDLAQRKGWHHAARCRQGELTAEFDYFQQLLSRLSDQLKERSAAASCLTESEVYRDLVALDQEFSDVECDVESRMLSATTQPIVLEGINLGRFQIRLDWRLLRESQPYTVVALDPHPAESNESVTHPHVSDEVLCEGDGRRAVNAALATGRLLDFFWIVDRLLNTYAEGRAYVELDHWEGVSCHDCGSIVSGDERWCCDRCEGTICSDCSSHCPHCDRTCCGNCSTTCLQCDESSCISCLERCPSCGRMICPDCFLQESNHCVRCHEELHEQTEPDSESPSTEDSDPALHSDGVGETAVPA